MEKLTNKDLRILSLINDFVYLDLDFFINVFHSRAKTHQSKIKYRAYLGLKKLIDLNYVEAVESHDLIAFYKITDKGRLLLISKSIAVYKSSLKINSAKFHHHRLTSLVYSKLISRYDVKYLSERALLSTSSDGIVPDLAIKNNNTIVYFEIELSQKSEKNVKQKLSKYEKNFSNGYIIYLTDSNAVIKTIAQLKNKFINGNKIKAYNLYGFMKNPSMYLSEIHGFSEVVQ